LHRTDLVVWIQADSAVPVELTITRT